MKLVINISEQEYNECKNLFNMIHQEGYINYNLNTSLVMYVANGTPFETELKNQKTGHWIENAPEWQNVDPPYICSECGNFHLRKTNYCDQCGAKMGGE